MIKIPKGWLARIDELKGKKTKLRRKKVMIESEKLRKRLKAEKELLKARREEKALKQALAGIRKMKRERITRVTRPVGRVALKGVKAGAGIFATGFRELYGKPRKSNNKKY